MDFSYKEYMIPKKNGKFRKIVAPSQDLLLYQQAKLVDIEKLYKSITHGTRLETIINGFVPGKNCVTAAKQHIGFKSTVVMDLSNFFDTVTRDMFSENRIYASIYGNRYLFHAKGYCAQGFATSPILANIAFIPAIVAIDRYLKTIYKKRYAFTIYADDLQISTDEECSKYIKKEIVDAITFIIQKAKFEVNPTKTRIRYSKYGYRKILGINVGDTELRGARKIMRKMRAANHQENGPSLGGLTTWSRCFEPKNQPQYQ